MVHPKDKMEIEEASEVVYRIPCTSCDKVYVGETGKNFGVRMNEPRKEAEQNEEQKFTRSTKQAAEPTYISQQSQITFVEKIISLTGSSPKWLLKKVIISLDGFGRPL